MLRWQARVAENPESVIINDADWGLAGHALPVAERLAVGNPEVRHRHMTQEPKASAGTDTAATC